MNRLDDAWAWYDATRRQLRLMGRLADQYWNRLPWADGLDRDDHFRAIAGSEVIVGETRVGLAALDDLAVVVLFSVFEAQVREAVLEKFAVATAGHDHPVVRKASEDAEQWIREGSFFRILDAYKAVVDKNLVEHVNQVRKYRNWVAHGRRGANPPDNVTPRLAFDRLAAFLAALGLG